RQGPQRVERGVDLAAYLGQHQPAAVRIRADRRLGEAQLDGEGDEVLLRAVVDVALEPAAFLVLGGDDPLPRRAQLGGLHGDLIQTRLEVGGQARVRQ